MLHLSTITLTFGLGALANHVLHNRPLNKKRKKHANRMMRINQRLHPSRHRTQSLPTKIAKKKRTITPQADQAETLFASSISLAGLGASSALLGIIYPVFNLSAIFVSGYLTVPFFLDGLRKFRKQRHLMDLIDAAVIPLLLLFHQVLAVSFLLLFTSIGRYVLTKTYDHSRRRLTNVFGELPKKVWIVHEASEIEINYQDLKTDDIVVVGAGMTIPIDGTILKGSALIDQHKLTGEAMPVEKAVGDQVIATTLLVSGRLHIRTERSGTQTYANEITQLIINTADRRLQVQVRGEARVEAILPYLLTLSAITGIVSSPVRAISVYMAAPGYTMRVLGPLSLLQALRHATKQGVLIKDGRSLGLIHEIDTVIFDKTGTLTDGTLHVTEVYPTQNFDSDTVLKIAATVEAQQSHPIAKAISAAAIQAGLSTTSNGMDHTEYLVGQGICARTKDREIMIGSATLMSKQGFTIPVEITARAEEFTASGMTYVLVSIDQQVAGLIALKQVLQRDAIKTIKKLKCQGLKTAIISGDNFESTRYIAKRCGIDHFYAEALPADKITHIKAMQQAGHKVCYIGDGINDAGALRQADVSISIRGASDIAIDTAQIVLLSPDLALLPKVFSISERYEAVTETASQWTTWLPSATLPIILFGHGGMFWPIIAHEVAFWRSLYAILQEETPIIDSLANKEKDNP
ncbi:heavy metal translocating P-type ATPase [Magnetococcales bacterium HHB-1]